MRSSIEFIELAFSEYLEEKKKAYTANIVSKKHCHPGVFSILFLSIYHAM